MLFCGYTLQASLQVGMYIKHRFNLKNVANGLKVYYAPKLAHYAFWHFPNFLPIMLIFMLSRYALCQQFIFIIVFLHKNDHDKNKMWVTRATVILKCIKIDVSASIYSNFNSYLTVKLSLYIPHLQLIIICQSYKLTI